MVGGCLGEVWLEGVWVKWGRRVFGWSVVGGYLGGV